MKYKIGHETKPLRISNGIVVFTDGTNEIEASQYTCEAYGYKYHHSSGTCRIQATEISSLKAALRKGYNYIVGKKNVVNDSVYNSIVLGSQNRIDGDNKNMLVNGNNNIVETGVYNSAIVSGDSNVMSYGVNNSTIISGVGAISIRDNETIVGGFYTEGRESLNFTTQESSFMMQASADNTTSLTKLNTAEGLDHIKTHVNSFISITAECLITGSTLQRFSAGTLTGQISTGSNGIPLVIGTEFTPHYNLISSFGNHSFYLATDSSTAVIRTQGVSGELVQMVASVKATELIHDPAVTI